MKKELSDMYFLGRKCIFCDKYGLYKLKDKRVKCKHCKKYYSLIKLRKDLEILYYFYLEVSAKKTSNEMDLGYGGVYRKFIQFRKLIADYCNKEARKLNGELELDESYFGGRRKGKRGRGANNKAIAFGILERKGKIHTIIVPNVKEDTLMDAIKQKTKKGSVFYTDGFKSYNSLQLYGKHNIIDHKKDKLMDAIKQKTKKGSVFYTDGFKSYNSLQLYGKHNIIDHKKDLVKGKNHINGIESFWAYAKERFHKYHGINKKNYPFYVKEMEFRFNHRNENVYKLLVSICIVRG